MSRNQKTILADIKKLVEELEAALGDAPSAHKKGSARLSSSSTVPRGALGAITMLIDEGFFDTPKEISTVMEKLKEVGHYHKRTAVAMNLLNLTKRRILNRFESKETKNWGYVIRK